MGERVDRTKTRTGGDRKLARLSRSALYRSHNCLTMENGEHDLIEIEMVPGKVKDDKPICMAVAILQQSKLLFLRFVYDILFKYLTPGSYKLNYCDTDSLCVCE